MSALLRMSGAFVLGVGLFLGGTWVYGAKHGYVRDVHPIAEVRGAYREAGGPILFFGSSVAYKAGKADTDRRDLAHMLSDRLGGERVIGCTHDAYHPGIFLKYARMIRGLPHAPKRVIVPVNLRAFSPSWHLHPSWQFRTLSDALQRGTDLEGGALAEWIADQKVLPHEGVRRVFLLQARRRERPPDRFSFGDGGRMTFAEFDRVYYSEPEAEEERLEKLRMQYRVHYLDGIGGDHEMLAALIDLHREFTGMGSACLFYLTPINVEELEGLWPGTLPEVRRNVRFVTERLGGAGAEVLDLHDLLPGRHFISPKFSTEHIDAAGKRQVIDRIVQVLMK